MTRYSPKMDYAVELVASNPGCPKLYIADRVGPNGSRKYGYETVNRAIAAGRIRAELRPNGHYALYAR